MKPRPWIIQFTRPLILTQVRGGDGKPALVWAEPSGPIKGLIRYWNGGSWATKQEGSKKFKTRESAEKKAFDLVLKDHFLIGMLEVVEFRPISRPLVRR